MGFQVETACHKLELGQNMSCSGLEVRSEVKSWALTLGENQPSHPGMNVGSRYCVPQETAQAAGESWMSSS